MQKISESLLKFKTSGNYQILLLVIYIISKHFLKLFELEYSSATLKASFGI